MNTKTQILEAFQLFDTDKSNTIDKDELQLVFLALGIDKSKHSILEFLKTCKDKQEIEFEEFYEMMKMEMTQDTTFTHLNNGNGLTKEILSNLFKDIGECVDDDELLEIMTNCDLDRDGIIGIMDFDQIVMALQ